MVPTRFGNEMIECGGNVRRHCDLAPGEFGYGKCYTRQRRVESDSQKARCIWYTAYEPGSAGVMWIERNRQMICEPVMLNQITWQAADYRDRAKCVLYFVVCRQLQKH